MDLIKKASQIIKESNYMVALTGAGISTESGIPDFRSPRGLYREMPEDALSRDVLLGDPERFYSEGYIMLKELDEVQPNKGHLAMAELQKMGYLNEIITQNIDSLHTKAGSDRVLEVHGESRGIHCSSCSYQGPFSVMRDQVDQGTVPPLCPDCNRPLRPNVVLFGDAMPPAFDQAFRAVEKADTMLVVGSSLRVMPVAYLPRQVNKLIIINNEPTPYDSIAEVAIHVGAGKVLSDIVQALKDA